MMLEYLGKVLTVWFIGFFPWAEIYVAVPAGFGLGLDMASVVFWSVFGNYVPAFIITGAFDRIIKHERAGKWIRKISSPRVKLRIEKSGIWATLLLTPWIGVWAMAATVKLFGMKSFPFLWASFVSILVYAIVLAALITGAADFFTA